MTRWITFLFAIAAVTIIVSITLLWSRSHSTVSATASMPSLAELHATAGVSRLPVQEIGDQSLIFSPGARR